MNWNDFFTGVLIGWIVSLFITIIFLYLRLKEYDDDED
jgi:hypothetical protein